MRYFIGGEYCLVLRKFVAERSFPKKTLALVVWLVFFSSHLGTRVFLLQLNPLQAKKSKHPLPVVAFRIEHIDRLSLIGPRVLDDTNLLLCYCTLWRSMNNSWSFLNLVVSFAHVMFRFRYLKSRLFF